MGTFQCENAIVERCLPCNGIWFDEREIGQFRAGLEKLDLESLKREFPYLFQSCNLVSVNKFTFSSCPVCHILLFDGEYT